MPDEGKKDVARLMNQMRNGLGQDSLLALASSGGNPSLDLLLQLGCRCLGLQFQRKPPLLPNFHGLRVLLVDDDDILRLHKELLSKVTSVSSGFHCLNSLAPPSIPAVDSALHVPQMDGFSRHEDRKRKLGVGHQSFFDKQAPRRMHWCCPAEQG
ncbi:hypothetical protein HPP92_008239 [Vanilla planifolia]|uniref:Uncharacterized protein n=1 Tax=Vanilla planifolia TaxID=51239 RepID=A0A835V3K7_VANPL|nr:hypothetical protein HPP92_008239 [Vanilla planifolia]